MDGEPTPLKTMARSTRSLQTSPELSFGGSQAFSCCAGAAFLCRFSVLIALCDFICHLLASDGYVSGRIVTSSRNLQTRVMSSVACTFGKPSMSFHLSKNIGSGVRLACTQENFATLGPDSPSVPFASLARQQNVARPTRLYGEQSVGPSSNTVPLVHVHPPNKYW
jgi:hypothetical protein